MGGPLSALIFMVFYEKVYEGDDPVIAEKENFRDIVEGLSKAKENGQSFFLISSSIVFDRAIQERYTESSVPNSNSISAKFLVEAEKQVMQYQNGFVYRVQDLMSRLYLLFEKMRNYNGTPTIPRSILRPLSSELYAYLLNDALIGKTLFEDKKLIHFAVPSPIDLELIWFSLRGGAPFECNDESTFEIDKYKGFLESEFILSHPLYKDFLTENNKNVMRWLYNFRRDL